MSTPNMNLDLPVVSVTLGPTWANELNAALNLIDAHDHSSGFGVTIKPAGMDINTDLDFQSHKAANLLVTQYTDQTAVLSGATYVSSVYSKSGDLYWTNGAGVAVQLTSGSSIISAPSSVDNFQFDNINTDIVISPSDSYVVLNVDTSAARSITLPSASAVIPGRVYMIHDATDTSETNNITISPDGADTIELAASDVINSNGATKSYVSDGIDNWITI